MDYTVKKNIELAIDDFISLTKIDIRERKRYKQTSLSRQAFIAATRNFLDGANTIVISSVFGLDHSTVVYACKMMDVSFNRKDKDSLFMVDKYNSAAVIVKSYNNLLIEKDYKNINYEIESKTKDKQIESRDRLIDSLNRKIDKLNDKIKMKDRVLAEFNDRVADMKLRDTDPDLHRINELRKQYIK